MYGLTVDANWCPDGVELAELPPVQIPGAEGTLAGGYVPHYPIPGPAPPTPIVFRHRTERSEPVRFEFKNLESLIVVEFINAGGDERLRQFFERRGLTAPGKYVLRDDVLQSQVQFRLMLQNTDDSAIVAVKTANDIIATHHGFNLRPTWHLAGQRGATHVTLKSTSLLGFMLMETSIATARGAHLTTCEQCATAFLTGKSTSRRASARFCSDRCRVAAMRARQADIRIGG